jgi:hypothetical protein
MTSSERAEEMGVTHLKASYEGGGGGCSGRKQGSKGSVVGVGKKQVSMGQAKSSRGDGPRRVGHILSAREQGSRSP